MIEKQQKRNVDIWQIPLNTAASADLFALLSKNEQNKFAELKQTTSQNNYLISHATTRIILGQYLNIPPQQVKIITKANKKPILEDLATKTRLDFNLTHSENLCLLAVSLTAKIGIDLEYKRKIKNCLALAHRFFAEDEYKLILSCSKFSQNEMFLKIWTTKEAILKGANLGISGNLDKVIINLHPKLDLTTISSSISKLCSWTIHSIPIHPDYIATLAVNSENNVQINYPKLNL